MFFLRVHSKVVQHVCISVHVLSHHKCSFLATLAVAMTTQYTLIKSQDHMIVTHYVGMVLGILRRHCLLNFWAIVYFPVKPMQASGTQNKILLTSNYSM